MSDEHKLATLAAGIARQQKQIWASYDREEIDFNELRHRLGAVLGEACADPLAVLARAQAIKAAEAPTKPAAVPVQGSAPTDRAQLERLAEQVYAAAGTHPRRDEVGVPWGLVGLGRDAGTADGVFVGHAVRQPTRGCMEEPKIAGRL